MLFTALLTTFAALATAADPFCFQKSAGIYSPTNGQTLSQKPNDSGCNNFEILYCSGQYFKSRSVDASAWLSSAAYRSGNDPITAGVLLTKGVYPDNKDAESGYSSYRFNVSICAGDGGYRTGPYVLSVYETYSGQFDEGSCHMDDLFANFSQATTTSSTLRFTL
jgi:hypothetical protein